MIGSQRRCATNLSAAPTRTAASTALADPATMQNAKGQTRGPRRFRIAATETPAWRKHGFTAFYFRTDPLRSCQLNVFALAERFQFPDDPQKFQRQSRERFANFNLELVEDRQPSFPLQAGPWVDSLASASGASESARAAASSLDDAARLPPLCSILRQCGSSLHAGVSAAARARRDCASARGSTALTHNLHQTM
jgi:hypothetical protein